MVFSPTVAKSSKPNESKAYIYGRLKKSGTWGKLGLVIENAEKTRQYLFRFKGNNKVEVLEVEPDTYVIKQTISASAFYTDARYTLQGYWPFRFQVDGNNAYYIGDLWFDLRFIGPHNYRWIKKEAVDRYEDASLEFEKKYPHIGKLPRQRAFEP